MHRSVRGLGVLSIAAALVLTGCTASVEPTPAPDASPTPTTAAPTTAAPVTLRFGVPEDALLRPAFEDLVRGFNRSNPGATAELVELDPSAELTAALATDPPDVFVAGSEQAPALVEAGLVQPVDVLMGERGITFGDSYQRLGLEAFSAQQSLQCMPYDVSPLVVLYNPGLVNFRRVAEPGDEPPNADTGWSFEEFTRAARQMSQQDGVKGLYVEPELDILMAMARSGGVDIVDDPRNVTTLTLSDGGTRAVLEEVLPVFRDTDLTPTARQLERRDALTRFAREQIGMLVGTRRLVPELREQAGFDFDVFPLPRVARSRSVASVSGFCLSAGTEQSAAAADFIAYAAGEQGARILARTGAVVPAHLPTLSSEAFTQPGESPASTLVFDEAVEKSSVVPFSPQWPDLRRAVEPDLEALFTEPLIDLDRLLPQIDERSRSVLSPEETEPLE